MFALLPILADLIPVSRLGLSASARCIVACVLTLLVGLSLSIAIGWFAYRPLLSVGLIAAAYCLP